MIIIYEVFNDIKNTGEESIDETNLVLLFQTYVFFSRDYTFSFHEEILSLLEFGILLFLDCFNILRLLNIFL